MALTADDLVTKEKYWNFELHAEYALDEGSNSGIGLRGRYEVQIASDYGRPPTCMARVRCIPGFYRP